MSLLLNVCASLCDGRRNNDRKIQKIRVQKHKEREKGAMDEESFNLVIKFVNDTEFTINANTFWTFGRLRSLIAQHCGKDESFIRLIYSGKLLNHNEDVRLVDVLPTKDATNNKLVLLCALSERKAGRHEQGVGDHQHVPVVGFARLVEAGFTQEEVQELRQQFQGFHGHAASPQEEERWLMEAPLMDEGQTQDGAVATTTTIYDWIFFGAVIGFLFPFAVVWGRHFKRAHMGVVIGASVNVAFQLLRIVFT